MLAAVLAATSCGGGSPTRPSPSPTPTPRDPGGVVTGLYQLRVEPAAACPAPARVFTFTVDAAADAARYPGVQIVDRGTPLGVEMELLYQTPVVRGGLVTTGDGVLANEGLRLWVRAIARGDVSSLRGQRGEVTQGTLDGTLSFGGPNDDEGALGSCTSGSHTWSLSAR